MNPDENNHLVAFLGHLQKTKRGSLAKFLAAVAPAIRCPELLSMWACFAGDGGFRDADFDDFNARTWVAAGWKMYRAGGVWPHAVDVAKSLRLQPKHPVCKRPASQRLVSQGQVSKRPASALKC